MYDKAALKRFAEANKEYAFNKFTDKSDLPSTSNSATTTDAMQGQLVRDHLADKAVIDAEAVDADLINLLDD